jgi:hypothetical protein
MSKNDEIYYVLCCYDIDNDRYDIRCRSDIYSNFNIRVDRNFVYYENKLFTIVYTDIKKPATNFAETLKMLYAGVKQQSINYKKHRATFKS